MKTIGSIIFILACLLVSSCEGFKSSPEGKNPDDTTEENVLVKAIFEWGVSKDYVIDHMRGDEIMSESGEDIVRFSDIRDQYIISYLFNEDKLCGTSLNFKGNTERYDISELLKGFSYEGELDSKSIYADYNKNTVVAIWQLDSDIHCSLGFAPIVSDLYPEADPIEITDASVSDVTYSGANISARINGVSQKVEVGIIYGYDQNLSEFNGKKKSTESMDEFSISISGLLDDETCYYRPYAVVDDLYYYGEINSFTTDVFTYEMGGKTFKMIKVEGGPLPPFSIMQTEWTDVDIIDSDKDGIITSGEWVVFENKILKQTGLPLRFPSTAEWQYAASGGMFSKSYIYSGSNDINEVAWYNENATCAQPPALKAPNELGLYDMSGNYSEMTESSSIKHEYCNTEDTQCGGNWKNASSACQIYSSIPSPNTGNEKHRYDASSVSFRFAYSRDKGI